MQTIHRKNYESVLRQLKDKHLIKAVTGVRRCGKSTLLNLFRNSLLPDVPVRRIQSYNFEVPENLRAGDWQRWYDKICAGLVKGKPNYIFLDEVQAVPEFEKLLDGLFIRSDVDLYVTGSNAKMLSSELATLLTGRAFEINILPFSFAEFVQTCPSGQSPERLFADYLQTSSFPQAVELAQTNRQLMTGYLQEVYASILEKDLGAKRGISSRRAFQNVVNFVMDAIGSPLSPNKIASRLKQEDKAVDSRTVESYLSVMVGSYLFYKVNRFDIKGKAHLATQEKYYLVDVGLRNALLGKDLASDSGHQLENVVYLELLRRGNQVWIGKIGNAEVDFVVRDPDGYTKYIQVAQTVHHPETLARELAPFDKIPDHNERILLTMDWETGSRNGVKQVNVVDWLLDGGKAGA
jgi:predicted AAA+ superfamily ATPase